MKTKGRPKSKNVEDATTKDGSPSSSPLYPGDEGYDFTSAKPAPYIDIPEGRIFQASMEKAGRLGKIANDLRVAEAKKAAKKAEKTDMSPDAIKKRQAEAQRKYDEARKKKPKAEKAKFLNPTPYSPAKPLGRAN
jgi:hypothetical protein